MTIDRQNIIEKCYEVAREKWGGRVLYICEFGSHLYGTTTSSTKDIDIKCIFLPFQYVTDSMKLSGKVEDTGKFSFDESWNSTTDHEKVAYEIELWSLQVFLHRFLRHGDTGAVDVAFSYFKEGGSLYCDDKMKEIFCHLSRCFSPKDSRAFLGYAIGQATRYGVKGIRLKLIQDILAMFSMYPNEHGKYNVYRFVDAKEIGASDNNIYVWDIERKDHVSKFYYKSRLEDWIDRILASVTTSSHCSLVKDESGQSVLHTGVWRILRINGKEHQGSIYMTEFLKRMIEQAEEFGHRAIKAAESGGKDWKALSHAYRVIREYIELLREECICFPLSTDYIDTVIHIKSGVLDIDVVRELISEYLIMADHLRETSQIDWTYDSDYIDSFILRCYT